MRAYREQGGGGGAGEADGRFLAPRERRAALEFVRRVRERVPAELARAFVFGSKARGEARPDSDVDVLLVFRRLPWDREPQAGMAEEIAEEVADESGIPVQTWSVSLVDLERGNRTPMLVDALNDGIPLWPPGAPPIPMEFTPPDAMRCVDALLTRVREGAVETAEHLHRGEEEAAWRRVRDDLVRLCVSGFLLAGETEPRRADAVRRFRARWGREFPPGFAPIFRWAAESFGADGRDEERPVDRPPGGLRAAAAVIDALRAWLRVRHRRLARRGWEPGFPRDVVPGGRRPPRKRRGRLNP